MTTQEIGLEVLALLRRLDDVAYLRFASVYKDFQEVTDFERELGLLLQKRDGAHAPAKARSGKRPAERAARSSRGPVVSDPHNILGCIREAFGHH